MGEVKYKIGKVASMLHLEPYVIRFWETEFPQLAPGRTEKGQRFYAEADIGILRKIQQLLHEQGMTIEGARRILSDENREQIPVGETPADSENMAAIAQIQLELTEIYELLKKGA